MADLFTAGEKLTAAKLNAAVLAGTIIARARRTTNSSTATTTEVGVLRLDDIPTVPGRLYEIVYECTPNSSVNTDTMGTRCRYTTDGSTPTTSSAILPDTDREGQDDGSTAGNYSRSGLWTATIGAVLSVLLCVRRVSGTGNVSLFADGADRNTLLWIVDRGLDPGDSGTLI